MPALDALGGIFIGAVHDFSALVDSVRHQARSIADTVKENPSRRAWVFGAFTVAQPQAHAGLTDFRAAVRSVRVLWLMNGCVAAALLGPGVLVVVEAVGALGRQPDRGALWRARRAPTPGTPPGDPLPDPVRRVG